MKLKLSIISWSLGLNILFVTCAVIGVYVLCWVSLFRTLITSRFIDVSSQRKKKNGQFICCRVILFLGSVFPGIHFWEIEAHFLNANNFLISSVYWVVGNTDFMY